MNRKEIAEIRRRFRPERSNIRHVVGCLVNGKKEIVTTFDQPLGELCPLLTEQVLPLLRRTLSGSLGRNLHSIPFSTRQVSEGEEHKCLDRLRRSALQDKEALGALYDRIRLSLDMDGNYLILLTQENYDVPQYTKSGDRDEEGGCIYSYILCSICPVRTAEVPSLGFVAQESTLRCFTADPCVARPELGFLFPAFDGRETNLYSALYYTRSISDNHAAFAEAVFASTPPMPVVAQRASFRQVLSDAVSEDCRYEVVERVREQIGGIIEAHKAERDPEPLYVTGNDLRDILCASGMSEEKGETFLSAYADTFGGGAELCPENLLDPRKLVLETPDVSIRVSADRGDLIETRVIDGAPCVVIRVEGDVTLNGVSLCVESSKDENNG